MLAEEEEVRRLEDRARNAYLSFVQSSQSFEEVAQIAADTI